MKRLLILLMLISLNNYANIEEGKELHEESCINCHIVEHNKDFYTRDNRKSDSYFKLKQQVSFCVSNLGIEWFPDEQMSVIEYLNQTYYHHKTN